jgi:hypothetical protein
MVSKKQWPPARRAAQIGDKPDTVKAKVPTSVLFTGGVHF